MAAERDSAAPFALPGRWRGGPLDGLLAGGACGIAALVLYVATCSSGVEWQDSGIHQYRVLFGLAENPYGLALSHPLHYYLGRAVIQLPFGGAAYKLNLMSAIFGAAGVGLLAAILYQVTRRPAAVMAGATALALAHTYWQMSVVTETYTLATALMAAEWLLLLQYARSRQPLWLVAVFAVNGLHVADHLLGLLTLVTYVVLLIERIARKRLPAAWLLPAAVAWTVAAMPYWTLVLAHYVQTGNAGATLYSAFFGLGVEGRGYAEQVLNVRLSWRVLGDAARYLAYNFPSLVIPIAIWGSLRPERGWLQMFRRVLLLQTAIIVLFVVRYSIADQITYYVPVCMLAALWFGLGVDRLLHGASRLAPRGWVRLALVANALLPLVIYAAFPPLARSRGWFKGQMREVPYREPFRYFLQPWRCGDDSAARFAAEALRSAGPGGFVLANLTAGYSTACWQRENGGPPGVNVFCFRTCLSEPGEPGLTNEELMEQLESNGTAVVAPFDALAEFWTKAGFRVERAGVFWRLRAATPAN